MTALNGVEVKAGVNVKGTEVVGEMVIVCVTTCVAVPVGVDMSGVEVLVGAAGVMSMVAVIGKGKMIGVALKMIGVEDGPGVEVM